MCDMCNGASLDELRFGIHGRIERYGWALQYVGDISGPRSVAWSWCYTVGLAAGFDHPELVVLGLEEEMAGGLLNAIGDLIRDGERLTPGEVVIDGDGEHFHLSRVHPAHFTRGVFAMWVDYYRALGTRPLQSAIEVVPPGRLPRLDQASSPIGAPTDHRPRRRNSNRRRPRGR